MNIVVSITITNGVGEINFPSQLLKEPGRCVVKVLDIYLSQMIDIKDNLLSVKSPNSYYFMHHQLENYQMNLLGVFHKTKANKLLTSLHFPSVPINRITDTLQFYITEHTKNQPCAVNGSMTLEISGPINDRLVQI